MIKKILFLSIPIVILVALWFYFQKNPPRSIEQIPTSDISNQEGGAAFAIYAANFQVPWGLVFLPDGRLLVTERKGTVRVVSKEGKLQEESVLTIGVKQEGERGLHGIVLHPDFKNNKKVYLYYTYNTLGDKSLNRVASYKFDDKKLTNSQTILENIPAAIFHDGGRMKFGPDGYLYITTGDALNPSLAQDKNSLAGKILRVTDEGKPAPGNPFGNEVFSFGHRNPQGITWDDSGRLWETEHGQTAQDEVNLIKIGDNYGWPTVRGNQTKEGVTSPIIQSDDDTWAPAGLAYIDGSLYFGGLRGQTLFEAKINGEKLDLSKHFEKEFGRIRDVIVGPDNMLYITTSNRDGRGNPASDDDKIIRVNPKKI